VVIPAPAVDATAEQDTATAIFAGGCFWGVQGVFQHVDGVTQALSGYAGGAAETPPTSRPTAEPPAMPRQSR
jgi:peptide-methionine (S)-S-oxide reductase